ncbi:hypothetical protein [Streptomyces alfalfae]
MSGVDVEGNTARVLVDMARPDQAVTVLLDQLANVTGVEESELPGLELDVTANVDAERQEEIVLTGLRAQPVAPLPAAWRKETTAPEGEEATGD